MMAVVLAGGLGLRLRPYTMNIPKPLLPLGDTPTIEIVLRQLANQGFSRIVLTLGHLPELITAILGNGARFGLRIDYQVESVPLGTAGPLRMVEDLDDTFLVMNGDLLTTIDYADVVRQTAASTCAASIVAARRQVGIDYGVVHVTEDGRLDHYDEKPTLEYLVSTGVYGLRRDAVQSIPPGRYDMPQLMAALAASGQGVQCLKSDSYWQDIGRFDDYQQASADFVASPGTFMPDGADPQRGGMA